MKDDDLMKLAYETLNAPNVMAAPKMVPGRVLHADADIFSYKACNLEYPYAQNVSELKELISAWRVLAGAEFIVLHLTMGTKGGREQIAQVKKYQGNRSKSDQDKQQRVHDLRLWMAEYSDMNVMSSPQYAQEADDSMCQAMHRSLEQGRDDVLFSPDKDLWMVPGKHLNKDTFEIEEFPLGYGRTYFTTDKNGKKKLIGKGTSWFWHQILMGDSADNIPGLPLLTSDLVMEYAPTQSIINLKKRVSTGRMPNGSLMNHNQKYDADIRYKEALKKAKPKKIGAVLAQKYLNNCNTDKAAYRMVLEAYASWYGLGIRKTEGTGVYSFYNWNSIFTHCTPYEMMLEQARLLWMRRTEGEDVEDWLEEIGNG